MGVTPRTFPRTDFFSFVYFLFPIQRYAEDDWFLLYLFDLVLFFSKSLNFTDHALALLFKVKTYSKNKQYLKI